MGSNSFIFTQTSSVTSITRKITGDTYISLTKIHEKNLEETVLQPHIWDNRLSVTYGETDNTHITCNARSSRQFNISVNYTYKITFKN
jgi:hypothetical protein